MQINELKSELKKEFKYLSKSEDMLKSCLAHHDGSVLLLLKVLVLLVLVFYNKQIKPTQLKM